MEAFYPDKVMRYCPRCGAEHFTFQDDSSFLCRACALRYYINASAAVIAIIENSRGEVLFTRRSREPAKDMLDLPGGFIDVMESAEDALRREIREELNLEICEFSYFGSFPNRYLYGGLVYFTVDLVFICSINNLDFIIPGDDVSGYSFIDPAVIDLNEIGLESPRNVITAYNAANNSGKQS